MTSSHPSYADSLLVAASSEVPASLCLAIASVRLWLGDYVFIKLRRPSMSGRMSCIHEETLRYIEDRGFKHPKRSGEETDQKNRSQIRKSRRKPTPANGPYYDKLEGHFRKSSCGWVSRQLTCLINSSQLMRTAAFLYLLLSSRRRPDSSPMRSKLSPLYKRSSIFLVITLVTSRSSSFNRSRFCDARLS